jgi:ATP synthase F1 delta subunit
VASWTTLGNNECTSKVQIKRSGIGRREILSDNNAWCIQCQFLFGLTAEYCKETITDFVGVVTSNRRLSALRSIVNAFAALVAQKRGIIIAEVTSAHALTDVQENHLRARLIEAGYGQVNIQKHIDPSLLGGLVVKIGARLYDTSLKSRLQRLQYAMKGAA